MRNIIDPFNNKKVLKLRSVDVLLHTQKVQADILNAHSIILKKIAEKFNLQETFMEKIFKERGIEILILPRFTEIKPANCKRLGRVDIPHVKGFLSIFLMIYINKKILFWHFHWEKEICVYWEV